MRKLTSLAIGLAAVLMAGSVYAAEVSVSLPLVNPNPTYTGATVHLYRAGSTTPFDSFEVKAGETAGKNLPDNFKDPIYLGLVLTNNNLQNGGMDLYYTKDCFETDLGGDFKVAFPDNFTEKGGAIPGCAAPHADLQKKIGS